jgi:hypothetical protein
MARLTIEDRWWTDPRREKLGELLGSLLLADAWAMRLWRLAQEYYGRGRHPIPAAIFESLEAAPKLVQAHLASVQEDGVYVRGSSEFTDWLNDKRATASVGGKKSAQRPRDAKGRLKKTSKQSPSRIQAEPKTVQPSGSGSGFGSGSRESPSGISAIALVPSVVPGTAIEKAGFNPVGLWCQLYRLYVGTSTELLKEDVGKLTNFGRGRSEEKLRRLFSCYFQIQNSFYQGRGYPVWAFFKDLQAISNAAETGVDPSKPKPLDYSKLKD